MTDMFRKCLANDRKGAVSVLFAGAAVPIIGLVGLAIDFSVLTQAATQMQLAADTAALSAAKSAANDFAGGDTANATNVGKAAGSTWFGSQIGGVQSKKGQTYVNTLRNGAIANTPTITVAKNGVQFNATVAYTGSAPATFSALFGVTSFPISGTVTATVALNAYINIAMLLDNSSSMLIGSTTNDINTMQAITACSPEGITSGQNSSAWTGPGQTCKTTVTPSTAATKSSMYVGGGPTSGKAPVTAACGFACHWSTDNQTVSPGKPDYTQYDYYALARNPSIGTVTGYSAPTLRFDVVQSATATVIAQMNSNEVIPNQFGLGVFEFNSNFTQVFPSDGTEAATDLTAGQTAVQAITTPVVSNNGDTDFPDAMTALANKMSAAGDGSSSATPRKNLFIVTDGIQDYGSRSLGNTMGPFSNTAAVNACAAIKAKGIAIYVLYTPYTPLPYNPFYKSNIDQYVTTPPTPNLIAQALQACASSPNYFYEADLPSQVVTGLQTLLKSAVQSPARISS
jgi:Flp pilus assembly protein TadG